jgi:hypothetical protein
MRLAEKRAAQAAVGIVCKPSLTKACGNAFVRSGWIVKGITLGKDATNSPNRLAQNDPASSLTTPPLRSLIAEGLSSCTVSPL